MTDDERDILIEIAGKTLLTPAKKLVRVPTRALADAIASEFAGGKKFSPSNMPLTSLAYTAIDRIEGNKDAIIEALMVYTDTDTLSYRSNSSEKMVERQKKDWVPILNWASKEFGSIWQTVDGIEPAVQTPEMHAAIRAYLESLSAMQLSAFCILASSYSSLILAVAVLKKRLDAEAAFQLSRLEEEVQAEQWGRVDEAEERTGRVKAEIAATGRFLRLLEAA